MDSKESKLAIQACRPSQQSVYLSRCLCLFRNVRYYRNESMFDEEDGYNYTLTFSINFPHDNDTVYLAHCYPYTYRYVRQMFTI